jgi:hypothetical protein
MRATARRPFTFVGFLLQVIISMSLWLLLTAIIAYLTLKYLGVEVPITEAILGLSISKLYEQELAV